MAESSISAAQDQLNCSICLNLLKDPVKIPCGHSYCMSCITDCWNDQDDQKKVYSCPQCRQTFTPRPVLGNNTMLAEVEVNLRKRKLQEASVDHCGESGDVECDVCTGDKNKAIKSCLVCLNSYCQNHFERHEEFHPGKRHKVTNATRRLQEMICPQHDKLLEIFCRTDQHCICYLCMLDEHKNHDHVSAAAERTEKQTQLEEMQRKFQQRIQERQKEFEELRKAVESYKRSAQTAVEDSERIFTELILSIERSRSEVKQLIRDQEKAAVSRAEELLEQLKKEINDLRTRDTEVDKLSHTDLHIHFLQSFQSISVPLGSKDSVNIIFSSHNTFDDVEKSVSHLREELEHFCREEIQKLQNKDFVQFTVDSNTVHKNLHLSEGNRVITYTDTDQPYPDHPDRFDSLQQVLCRESVCGRSYWEVEWSGEVEISVSYKSINRKTWNNDNDYNSDGYDKSDFGLSDQSWCLFCSDSSYSFWHDNEMIKLPEVSSSSRIGVYVDHGAGTLSFYSVSDTMTLIHRVQTTFTQPLYAGFGVYSISAVKLISK
ncbi:tripartite motif-containing protein 16-like isoform X2 [Puntigrus tetrazona]|uniref:tripartite motif-containing protein 16-like isoform X2 n=1 Tax=Puntigrus tetrazona TaxID=1606681 RepID=UPI001C8AEDA1|nr:tripartite motif-containing protein 16-like isoform X2 [Puntigrus tetrazona]